MKHFSFSENLSSVNTTGVSETHFGVILGVFREFGQFSFKALNLKLLVIRYSLNSPIIKDFTIHANQKKSYK